MTGETQCIAAPGLAVTRWSNTGANPTLAHVKGEVMVTEAFQMLCPGCVSLGISQAQRIQRQSGDDMALLGYHTVFEHRDAMTPVSLKAFLHEFRITHHVGVDALVATSVHSEASFPASAYAT